MSSRYRTSIPCKVEIVRNRVPQLIPATFIEVTNNGGLIHCVNPIPNNEPITIHFEGRNSTKLQAKILGNMGGDGTGYRLSLQLATGSWPYELFVMLTTLCASGDSGSTGSAVPKCISELGLGWPCSIEDVEVAFAKLVRSAHPDRGGDIDKFVRVRTAYLEALALLGGRR